ATDQNIRSIVPEYSTGPVGWPVGEPPGGSRLTASAGMFDNASAGGTGTQTRTTRPAGMTPSDFGGLACGNAHNSNTWPAAGAVLPTGLIRREPCKRPGGGAQ